MTIRIALLCALSLVVALPVARATSDPAPAPIETLFGAPLPSGKAPWPVQVWRAELPPGELLSFTSLEPFTAHPQPAHTPTREVTVPWRGEIRRHGYLPLLVFFTATRPTLTGKTLDLPDAAPERTGQASATAVLQRALDTARPGEAVIVPSGTYRIGTLRLRDGVELHLTFDARLVASDDEAEYPVFDAPIRYQRRALILFDGVRGAALTGPGMIDGRGSVRRRAMAKPTDHPNIKLVHVQDSSDITLRDVHLRDSYSWTVHVLRSTRVTISGVSVLAELSPRNWNGGGAGWIWNNADGINPDSSSDVLIEDCFIYAGDDAIAVRSTDPLHPTQNVTVRRTILSSPTRGLKIGTETRGEVMSGITFEDCDIIQAGEAIAIDLFDSATFSSVIYRDIRVHASPTGVHFLVKARNPQQTAIGRIEGVTLERVHLGPVTHVVQLTASDPRAEIRGITFQDVCTDNGPITSQQVNAMGEVNDLRYICR